MNDNSSMGGDNALEPEQFEMPKHQSIMENLIPRIEQRATTGHGLTLRGPEVQALWQSIVMQGQFQAYLEGQAAAADMQREETEKELAELKEKKSKFWTPK